MAFTPFMQSKDAQSVISDFINGKLDAKPNVNSAGVYRNPLFDLRTEQEKAGELDPSALYPNPLVDFSASEDVPVDPCPEGFMLVDGVCQPIEQFGQSMYQDDKTYAEDREEQRPYMSIDDMQGASNEELIDYLKGGYLSNSLLGYLPSKGGMVTLNNTLPTTLGVGLNLLGLTDPELRNNAMTAELSNRGYFTGNFNNKGKEVFDIASTPNPNLGFNEAKVPYGGAGVINEGVTGSYGGGEDFGRFNKVEEFNQNQQNQAYVNPDRGNYQAQQQAQQKEKERIDKVVQGMQSGKKTTFGGF